MKIESQLMIKGCSAALLLWIGVFFFVHQAGAGQKCGELLKEKCQRCHSLTRTCEKLGRDQESWGKTMAKMADYGSAITGKEQKTLVTCLAKQKKDVVALCR